MTSFSIIIFSVHCFVSPFNSVLISDSPLNFRCCFSLPWTLLSIPLLPPITSDFPSFQTPNNRPHLSIAVLILVTNYATNVRVSHAIYYFTRRSHSNTHLKAARYRNDCRKSTDRSTTDSRHFITGRFHSIYLPIYRYRFITGKYQNGAFGGGEGWGKVARWECGDEIVGLKGSSLGGIGSRDTGNGGASFAVILKTNVEGVGYRGWNIIFGHVSANPLLISCPCQSGKPLKDKITNSKDTTIFKLKHI